jgi:hypothetical protein
MPLPPRRRRDFRVDQEHPVALNDVEELGLGAALSDDEAAAGAVVDDRVVGGGNCHVVRPPGRSGPVSATTLKV